MGPNSDRKKRLSVHVVSMADGGAGRKEGETNTPNPEHVMRLNLAIKTLTL